MFLAFPLILGTNHTLNRWPCTDLCQQVRLLPSKLWYRQYLYFCQMFQQSFHWSSNKKYLNKRNPGPVWPEFQVSTVLLIPGKQFSECLPIYKHRLLLFTLRQKQLAFWLLTAGFWFSGYYSGNNQSCDAGSWNAMQHLVNSNQDTTW